MFSIYKNKTTKNAISDGLLVENEKYFVEFDNPHESSIAKHLQNSNLSKHLNWIKGNKIAELKITNYVGTIRLFDKIFDVRSAKFRPELSGNEQIAIIISELDKFAKGMSFTYDSSTYTNRSTNWLEVEQDYINKIVYLHQLFFSAPVDERIESLFQRIKRTPSTRYAQGKKKEYIWNLRKISPALVNSLFRQGLLRGVGSTLEVGDSSSKVEYLYDSLSADTSENRFLKFFFNYVNQLGVRAINSKKRLPANVNRKAKQLVQASQAFLTDSFFIGVGENINPNTNSTVLSSRAGYKEIFRYYVTSLFSVQSIYQDFTNRYSVDLKDIATLYEIWCFYYLACRILGVHIVISFKQSTYKNGQTKQATTFRNDLYEVSYNRTFSRSSLSSYSTNLRPDITVKNRESGKFYHFDAKYKVSSTDISAISEEKSEESTPNSYKNVDVNKMHSYLDAIYNSESSMVMYPGEVFGFFERGLPPNHVTDVDSDFKLSGVGAVSAVPGSLNEDIGKLLVKFF
jgi:predicted component of viral defense system (DUF524 family)